MVRLRETALHSPELTAPRSRSYRVVGPHCPACGAPTEPEARFCRECGAAFGYPESLAGDSFAPATEAFAVSDAISYGWRTTRANFPLLTGVSLLYLAISVGIRFGLANVGAGAMVAFLRSVLALAVDGVLSVGLITISLKLHDGQQAGFRDLMPRSDLVVRYLLVSAVVGVMVLGGLILLVVPGVILALTFGYAGYLVVDRGAGVGEALRGSSRLTSGVKWRLFRLGLASAGVLLLGALCLLIGLVVAFPVVQMATVYAYRRLLARAGGVPALS